MDEEMEDSVEYTFTAVEIDLDYEFDAVRYFDFSREESLAEARQAELWFEAAESYPPSPFVTKLVSREDILVENVITSPKPRDVEEIALSKGDLDVEVHLEMRAAEMNNKGLAFSNHMMEDNLKAKTKSSMKPSLPRTSTLMKPTASQLAKQNASWQLGDSRFQKFLAEKNKKSSSNPIGIDVQASKRQKLEGGHSRKVADTKPQTDFVHKAPKREGIVGSVMPSKLRITIPREPDLETAHRAQRMRVKAGEDDQNVKSTLPRFKARPLNRKILEDRCLLPKRNTPRLPEFQEFQLKTSERAVQHNSAALTSDTCSNSIKGLHNFNPSSTGACETREPSRNNLPDVIKPEGSELFRKFKALPLNKKIFSSKGEIGVFRNSKKEITVPVEFNFHTDKRVHHNPPIELFNKLTLTSDPQRATGSQPELPQHTFIVPTKGSKENRWCSFQQGLEVKCAKDKLPSVGGKQTHCGSKGFKTEDGPVSFIKRTLGIR